MVNLTFDYPPFPVVFPKNVFSRKRVKRLKGKEGKEGKETLFFCDV